MKEENGLLKAGYILNYVMSGMAILMGVRFIAFIASGNSPYHMGYDTPMANISDETMMIIMIIRIAIAIAAIIFTIKASKDDKFNVVAGVLGIFIFLIPGILILVGNSSLKKED